MLEDSTKRTSVNTVKPTFRPIAPFMKIPLRGALWGESFFTSFRSFKGKLFFMEAHEQRLMYSLKKMSPIYPFESNRLSLQDTIYHFLEKRSKQDYYFRPTFYFLGDRLAPTKLYFIIFYQPLETLAFFKIQKIKDAVLLPQNLNFPEIKTHHYSHVSRIQTQCPNKQALIIGNKGELIRAINGNIFTGIYKTNKIFYPPFGEFNLKGITSNLLIQKLKSKAQMKSHTPLDLMGRDALVTVNSVTGITPIAKYQGKTFQYSQSLAEYLLLKLQQIAKFS